MALEGRLQELVADCRVLLRHYWPGEEWTDEAVMVEALEEFNEKLLRSGYKYIPWAKR